jgi:hypothetical protein
LKDFFVLVPMLQRLVARHPGNGKTPERRNEKFGNTNTFSKNTTSEFVIDVLFYPCPSKRRLPIQVMITAPPIDSAACERANTL